MQNKNILMGLFAPMCHCEEDGVRRRNRISKAGGHETVKKPGFFARWAQNDITASAGQPGKAVPPLQNDKRTCHCERSVAIAELSRNQEPPSRHPAPDAGSISTDVGKKPGFFAQWAQNDASSSRHPELVSGSQGRNDATAKAAFTLAEVLITLGVIGVVAAVTLPTVINNMQARIRAEQVRSAKYKFTLATDKMNSLGLIGPYDSTEAFVKELQKHLKLAKVCPPGKLEGCWPTKEVKIDDEGTLLDISEVESGRSFKMEKNDKNDYSSDNVGIVTADGVPMIISYNKKCDPLDPVKQYAWTTEDNKPVSNATAGCVAAVMDINGSKKPNKLSEDVVLFNARGLGSGCGFKLNGKCFSAPIASYAPLKRAECEARKDELGIKDCMNIVHGDNDYWGGAVAACGHVSKMATLSDLGTIASAIYGKTIGATTDMAGLTFNAVEAGKLGIHNPASYIWSGEEGNSDNAMNRYIGSTNTSWANYGRYHTGIFAICEVD